MEKTAKNCDLTFLTASVGDFQVCFLFPFFFEDFLIAKRPKTVPLSQFFTDNFSKKQKMEETMICPKFEKLISTSNFK